MSSKIILIPFLLLIVGCHNQLGCPDIQDNPILTDNPPSSDAYQNELVRLIATDERKVNYYFEKREANLLLLNAYGWGYCGLLHLHLEQEDELSEKLQNDKGWRGAELKGLKVELVGKRLFYKGMNVIQD